MATDCNDSLISGNKVGPTLRFWESAVQTKLGKGIMYFLEREKQKQKVLKSATRNWYWVANIEPHVLAKSGMQRRTILLPWRFSKLWIKNAEGKTSGAIDHASKIVSTKTGPRFPSHFRTQDGLPAINITHTFSGKKEYSKHTCRC